MSQLNLPNKINRSLSNPLLIDETTETSGEYECSFIESDDAPIYNNHNIPKLRLSKFNTLQPPQTRQNILTPNNSNQHQKAQSGNDIDELSPFTLIDALRNVQSRRTDSVSVVSVLNLFVAQG